MIVDISALMTSRTMNPRLRISYMICLHYIHLEDIFSIKGHLEFSGFSSKQAAIIYENTKKESSSANIKREVQMADSKH